MGEEGIVMEIFAGLPHDIGRECLLRVPLTSHSNLAAVCNSWKNTVNSPLFYQDRKKLGLTQDLIIVIDEVNPTSLCDSGCRFSIYDPLQNSRQILHSVPMEFQHFLFDTHCVSVNQKLIVMGFYKEAEKMVFVYNFYLGRWNRGADLLTQRYGFCCSADYDKGLIYIAGGDGEYYDASVYNVEENSWEVLPPMTWGIDSVDYYSGVIDGKLLVVSLWLGRVQIYDPNTRGWKTLSVSPVDTCLPCMTTFGGLIYCYDVYTRGLHVYI